MTHTPANSITSNAGGTTFAGPVAVDVYRATAIASALGLYAKTGMKMNRAYTPKAMIAAAQQITGQTFGARDYLGAAAALKDWARAQAAAIRGTNELIAATQA